MYSKKKLCLAVAACSVLGGALQAVAQEQQSTQKEVKSLSGKNFTLEEVYVTARFKKETLQDIPMAINAFSSKQLERQDFSELRDIVRGSPGVSYDSQGSVATGNVSIRGMNQAGLVGQEANVAVFVDGIYHAGRAAASVPTMGLERVEVIRGPQSAIYGRNAFSGAMNYITKRPGDELEGSVEVTAGDNGREGLEGRIAGRITSTLAASLDVASTESGSTFKDNDKYLGSVETDTVRARFIYTPTENLEFDLSYTNTEMNENAQAAFEIDNNARTPYGYNFATQMWGEGAAEGYVGEIKEGDIDGVVAEADGMTDDTETTNLTIKWDFEGATLTSLSSYRTTETRQLAGYDNVYSGSEIIVSTIYDDAIINADLTAAGLGFPVFMPVPGTTIYSSGSVVNDLSNPFSPVANMYIIPVEYQGVGGQPNNDRDDFSQELRLSSDADSSVEWAVGLLYAEAENEEWLWSSVMNPQDDLSAAAIQYNADLLMGDPTIKTSTIHETTTKSAFFSVAYDFTDKLNVGFEARYTEEEKSIDNTLHNLYPGSVASGKDDVTFDWVSPRLTASYAADENTNIYFSAGKGTKSGGINAGEDGSEADYEPEENITYEIGAKRTILDGRGYMNIAAYFIDWDDQQIRDFSTQGQPGGIPSVIVTNLGKTEIKGIEIETAFQINEEWNFRAAYAFNDSEIKEGVLGTAAGFTDYAQLGMNSTAIENLIIGGFCDPSGFNPTQPTCGTQVSDGDISGNTMPNSVRNTASFGFGYSRLLTGGVELFGNVDYVWQDERNVDATNTLTVDAHSDVNLQLGLEGEHWYGSLGVKNLLDDDTPATSYTPYVWTGEPKTTVVNRNGRMLSMSVGYRF